MPSDTTINCEVVYRDSYDRSSSKLVPGETPTKDRDGGSCKNCIGSCVPRHCFLATPPHPPTFTTDNDKLATTYHFRLLTSSPRPFDARLGFKPRILWGNGTSHGLVNRTESSHTGTGGCRARFGLVLKCGQRLPLDAHVSVIFRT